MKARSLFIYRLESERENVSFVLPALAEFTQHPGLGYDALTLLFQSPDHGAQWVIPRLSGMMVGGQPLEMAMRLYTRMALANPNFSHKDELRSQILRLVDKRSSEAIYALGSFGTAADIPLLESIYEESKGREDLEYPAIASEAALARFGVKKHIDNIARQIATSAQWRLYALPSAVYSDRAELIPALCKHINDPAHWCVDYGDNPGGDARRAIMSLQHKSITDDLIKLLCKATAP